VDDSVAVYKELLKTYKPDHIVIYGTSAGAILTAEVAVKLKQLGLPLPAALGIFSGMGDFARDGDSIAMYALRGLSRGISIRRTGPHDSEYVGSTDPKDPVLSPIYADSARAAADAVYHQRARSAAERDGCNLHRAYLNAGVDARLVVHSTRCRTPSGIAPEAARGMDGSQPHDGGLFCECSS
jgi:epsilon-lactone hydrolase